MARTYFLESNGNTGFHVYTKRGGARGKREYVMTGHGDGCGTFKRAFTALTAIEYATKLGGSAKMGAAAADAVDPC